MSEPFLGQIQIVSFGYAPKGWADCNGQLLPIEQNQALFSLLGTTFGGNGQTTFALPDFRGRLPIHWGQGPGLSNRTLGENGGTIAATGVGVPHHTHTASGVSQPADDGDPHRSFLGVTDPPIYGTPGDGTPIQLGDAPSEIGGNGESPHENRQPYLGLRFIIALQGIFPSRT